MDNHEEKSCEVSRSSKIVTFFTLIERILVQFSY